MTRTTKHGIVASLLSLALLGGCSDDGGNGAGDSGPSADGAPDATAAPDSAPAASALQRLASWMTGTFDTEAQSKNDPTYYNITLAMKRIWPGKNDGTYWLYVEQAVAGQLPYRQRVYRLEETSPGSFSSRVYELYSPQLADAVIGAWKQPDPLASVTENELDEKPGCAVELSWNEKAQRFKGATRPKQCLTTHQGASYTESEVEVTAARLTSWDRGFDTSGVQVWGAVKGPYLFDKVSDLDPDLGTP